MVAFPIDRTDKETLSGNVNKRVVPGSTVYTDEHHGYKAIDKSLEHESITHSAGEYVRGQVHTNTIESRWSLLKRAHIGVYHSWSKKHIHRYINEITQRQNINDLPAFDDSNGAGITMIRMFMAGISGRRLTYVALIND